MDLLRLVASSRPPRPQQRAKRRRRREYEELLPTHVIAQASQSAAQVLAYVNMKCSLMFSDLAVGVAIPVYLEAMGLDIGSLLDHKHQLLTYSHSLPAP